MSLQIIWFILWGTLWAVYFTLDGFTLGTGIIYPFVAKNEADKRKLLNAIGPVWNGNEVWLITAGGATFAAFPTAYGILFSCFYSPMLLLIFSLILRGLSVEFRFKENNKISNFLFDSGIFCGSLFTALILGIFWGNIFRGIPIDESGYSFSFLNIINSYALITGLLFCLIFVFHGSNFLLLKVDGDLNNRIFKLKKNSFYFLLVISLFFVFLSFYFSKLSINYVEKPLLLIIPLFFIVFLFFSRIYFSKSNKLSFFYSSLTVLSFFITVFTGLFPNIVPSLVDSLYNVTIYNSSSGQYTLKIMTYIVLIFLPFVILYQTWVYKIFSSRSKEINDY